MSRFRCRLRNATSRPVEIHGDHGVLVLDPGGFVEVDAVDAALEALERAGVLTRHASPNEAAPEPVRTKIPAAEPAAAVAKSRRGKSEARRVKRNSNPKRPAAEDSGELP